MEKQKVNGGKGLDWDRNGNIMLSLKSKTKKKWIMDEREDLAMFENNSY